MDVHTTTLRNHKEKLCQYEIIGAHRDAVSGGCLSEWYLWVPAVVVQPLPLTVPDIPCLVFSVLFPFLPLCYALSNCNHAGFHFHIV